MLEASHERTDAVAEHSEEASPKEDNACAYHRAGPDF
jgi:hypothetical protein